MTTRIFAWAVPLAIVLAALGLGAWYLLAPPPIEDATEPSKLEEPGIIEGTTWYPSEYNPAQRVCAQSVNDTAYERCTDVPEQSGTEAPTFAIKVAPGTYLVYAFLRDPSDVGLDESRRAYWTEFVTCGLSVGCTSHERLEVTVAAGQTVRDIGPHDWYVSP